MGGVSTAATAISSSGAASRLLLLSVIFCQHVPKVLSDSSDPGGGGGLFLGKVSNSLVGLTGLLFAVDERTVYLKDYEYTGEDPSVFLYAGTLRKDGGYTKTGFALRDAKGTVQQLPSSRSATSAGLVFRFPETNSIFDIDWIGVLSKTKKSMYSRVLIDEEAKRQVPKPVALPALRGRNGLSSSAVVVMDSRSIVIRDFTFKGLAPGTHFWIGNGASPDESGMAIPDETGSMQPLKRYANQTVILTLPADRDVHGVSWLSVWSKALHRSLAHVRIPQNLNVPPAMETNPESELNCETLDSGLGLELRWSLSDSDMSILLQLVANTGPDRYLAIGIRADEEDTGGVGGDVTVGWIKAKSAKGGIDDYFLASASISCEDGAESCPDVSRKGGERNVELLNSVSRKNYTMLTFRRPVSALDPFDTPVLLDRPQNVFWSVGYKSPAMRKRKKPIKNRAPISIDFGRRPRWNCRGESEKNGVERKGRPKRTTTTPTTTTTSTTTTTTKQAKYWNSEDEFDNYFHDYLGHDDTESTVGGEGFGFDDLANFGGGQDFFSPEPFFPSSTRAPSSGLTDFASNGFRRQPPAFGMPTATPAPSAVATTPFEHLLTDDQLLATPVDRIERTDKWHVPSVTCASADQGALFLQVGPAAMHRGNQGIGPEGTAFYVNGILAPDIYLTRGKTYLFVIETGLGGNGVFQPVYLTTDSAGGYQGKSDYEKRLETVYAGMRLDREGHAVPGLMGRLCQWTSTRPAVTFTSYKDFHNSLNLDCPPESLGHGEEPAILTFTPTDDMPDTLYYQSFTTKHVGGLIRLVDSCFKTGGMDEEDLGVTTFRPDLDKYYGRLSKKAVVEFDPPGSDDVDLLQSLMTARNRRQPGRDRDTTNRRNDDSDVEIKRVRSRSRLRSTSDTLVKNRARGKKPVKSPKREKPALDRDRSHLRSNCVRKRLGLAAADGMPVFEHFPKRQLGGGSSIMGDTEKNLGFYGNDDDDCYGDEFDDDQQDYNKYKTSRYEYRDEEVKASDYDDFMSRDVAKTWPTEEDSHERGGGFVHRRRARPTDSSMKKPRRRPTSAFDGRRDKSRGVSTSYVRQSAAAPPSSKPRPTPKIDQLTEKRKKLLETSVSMLQPPKKSKHGMKAVGYSTFNMQGPTKTRKRKVPASRVKAADADKIYNMTPYEDLDEKYADPPPAWTAFFDGVGERAAVRKKQNKLPSKIFSSDRDEDSDSLFTLPPLPVAPRDEDPSAAPSKHRTIPRPTRLPPTKSPSSVVISHEMLNQMDPSLLHAGYLFDKRKFLGRERESNKNKKVSKGEAAKKESISITTTRPTPPVSFKIKERIPTADDVRNEDVLKRKASAKPSRPVRKELPKNKFPTSQRKKAVLPSPGPTKLPRHYRTPRPPPPPPPTKAPGFFFSTSLAPFLFGGGSPKAPRGPSIRPHSSPLRPPKGGPSVRPKGTPLPHSKYSPGPTKSPAHFASTTARFYPGGPTPSPAFHSPRPSPIHLATKKPKFDGGPSKPPRPSQSPSLSFGRGPSKRPNLIIPGGGRKETESRISVEKSKEARVANKRPPLPPLFPPPPPPTSSSALSLFGLNPFASIMSPIKSLFGFGSSSSPPSPSLPPPAALPLQPAPSRSFSNSKYTQKGISGLSAFRPSEQFAEEKADFGGGTSLSDDDSSEENEDGGYGRGGKRRRRRRRKRKRKQQNRKTRGRTSVEDLRTSAAGDLPPKEKMATESSGLQSVVATTSKYATGREDDDAGSVTLPPMSAEQIQLLQDQLQLLMSQKQTGGAAASNAASSPGDSALLRNIAPVREIGSLKPPYVTADSVARPLTTLGLGFDPAAVRPEEGFVPVSPLGAAAAGETASLPELAFNVLDTPQGGNILAEPMVPMKRMDSFSNVDATGGGSGEILMPNKVGSPPGDRGNLAVRVPAPVVPYVPPATDYYSVTPRPEANLGYRATTASVTTPRQPHPASSASSADFSDFKALKRESGSRGKDKKTLVLQEYHETDRIDVPSVGNSLAATPGGSEEEYLFNVGASMGAPTGSSRVERKKVKIGFGSVGDPEMAYPEMKIDPNTLLYSQNSKPYGQQYPSYVPDVIETRLDSMGGLVRNLPVGDDVVYGSGGVSPPPTTGSDDAPASRLKDRMQKLKVRLGMEGASNGEVIRLLRKLSGRKGAKKQQES